MSSNVVDWIRRLDGVGAAGADRGYVFFDVLGVYFVFYSARVARWLHAAGAAGGLALAARRDPRGVAGAARAAARTAAAVGAAASAAFLYGVVLTAVAPMRWYAGGVAAALGLFVPPALAAFAAVAARSPPSGPLALWGGLLAAAAALDLGSGYVALVAVAGLAPRAAAPALAVWLSVARTLLTIAVPLLGRVGSRFPMDPALGAVVGLLAGLGATLAGPPPRRPPPRATLAALALVAAAASVAAPYSAARPKRLTVQHVRRSIDGVEDAGLWVLPMDGQRLDPLFAAAPPLAEHPAPRRAGADCYLTMPWFFPFCDIVRGDAFVPAPPPPLAAPATLAATRVAGGVRVAVTAPSHAHLVVRGPLRGWRFDGAKDAPPPVLRAEGVYLAQLTGGACRDACAHAAVLEVAADATLDVALAAHHFGVDATPEIDAFVAALPAWARGAYWGKFASELILKRAV